MTNTGNNEDKDSEWKRKQRVHKTSNEVRSDREAAERVRVGLVRLESRPNICPSLMMTNTYRVIVLNLLFTHSFIHLVSIF